MSQIKTKEGTGLKRLNVNITTELHRRFKSATAAQGLEMTDRDSAVHREVCRQERTCRSQEEQARMKRAALYLRVSTVDQHPETQLLDLRQMAAQRGYEIVAGVHRQDQSARRPNGQGSIR